MRIAYLVYAHQHPDQLARLIHALDAEFAAFFVHIDAKVDARPFIDRVGPSPRVVFVADRVKVYWMGYSQVEATLALMRAAARGVQNGPFDRYVLLSGSDYPIRSNRHIREIFLRSPDTEYLMFWKLEDNPEWLHKIERYHLLDSRLTNRRAGFAPTRAFYQVAHGLIHGVLPKRRHPPGLIPYGGSSWWMLTHGAVSCALDYLDRHPDFVRFYRRTHAPDELVFHTILMNSPFGANVHNRSRYEEFMRLWMNGGDARTVMLMGHEFNLRYIEWDPAREFPATLDERDYRALEATNCLFARKMHPVRSSGLLDLIDARLRQ